MGRHDCTMGQGVCNSCKGQLVPLDEGEFVRIAELDYCPFAIDYTQEQLIIEMFNDQEANRMNLPKGEQPLWLGDGLSYIADWLDRNKD